MGVLCSREGISGTTAKSRQRKFVPSSHPGPFALVASSHKSQTKVGTLACFDFFVKELANYVNNPAMLFHVIKAVMYMPCVKCSCSELKLANICKLSSF